ncbi:unnamed protein product [Prunus armeniaca]
MVEEGPSKGQASLEAQYNDVYGHSSCLRLSQREFDSCPTSLWDIQTMRSEDAAQVDQVSSESCEECSAGDFVFLRPARMCRIM